MDGLQSPRSERQTPIDEPYNMPRTFLPQRLAGLQESYHDAPLEGSQDAHLLERGEAQAEVVMEVSPNFGSSPPRPSGLEQTAKALAEAGAKLVKAVWQLLRRGMNKKVAPAEASFLSEYSCGLSKQTAEYSYS